MANETIQKAPAGTAYRDQICGVVQSRRQHSERHFTIQRHKLPTFYDLYRGVATGRFHPHKNQVHIPLIFSTIQSDVARKAQTSFGVYPIVNMVGYGPDDAPIARKREALVDAQMKDAKSFLKAVDVFQSADLYGTSVVQIGWRRDVKDMMVADAAMMPMSGQSVRQIARKQVTMFDGPDWEVIDPLDCFPQPGIRDIDKMQWFIVRRFLDLDDIRQMAAEGVFDKSEVKRLEAEGGGATSATDELKGWRTFYRMEDDETARMQERYARPIEITEMWGVLPTELLPEDGIVDRVITVANNRYLLRNRPNPYWHGQKPFLAYSPMPDPHYFFAPGKAEIAEKLQTVANRFTNQTLDVLDLFIDPAFFYNNQAGLNTRNLYLRPGRFIGVDGNPSEMVMPIMPNLQGLQMGTEQTSTLWKWIQQGTGIAEDVVQGMGGNRQTAREFLGRQEAVATRLLLESRIAEEMFIEPLANMFNSLDQQFLETPTEVAILGQNAFKDPVTGVPVTMTQVTLDAFDMVPDYRARAQGATTRLNRATYQQNLTLLLQAVSANPMAAQTINWMNFFRMIFKAFEVDDVDELLAPAMNPMLQQAGMPQMGGQQQQIPGTPNEMQGPQDMAQMLGTMTQGAPSQ